MNRIIITAALAIAMPFAVANAAGPFDGNYAGGSPGTGGRLGCPATQATVAVKDGKISGNYKSNISSFTISGTVAADGTVTGRWSVYPLTGKFTGGHFAGEYSSKECGTGRPVALDKSG